MSSAAPEKKPLRVFIVEDHPDTLRFLRMYLEGKGCVVHSARSLAMALAELPLAGCDVLICDIGLGDGTGWELLTRLREEGRPYPPFTVAMSGFGQNAERGRSEAAGFRHHLLKPLMLDDMDKLLEQAEQEQGDR